MEPYSRDYDWWQKAYELAAFGEHRVRVGAFAVASGVPVAGAWNRIRNTSKVDFTDISVHAEIACVEQVSKRLRPKITLYIARINVQNKPQPSHPCRRCIDTLRSHGVKAVCVFDQELRQNEVVSFLTKYKLT